MWKRVVPITLFALGIMLFARSAGAQSASTATLYPVDTSQFPVLSAYLDVRDDQGNFVPGLQAGDVRMLENNRSLPIDNLAQLNPGTQFVVAVSPGDSMGIRDSLGNSRYRYITTALTDWAESLPNTLPDDLSLVIGGGPQIIHTSTIAPWLTALQGYEPTTKEDASLQVLATALDTADDPTDREGMSRVILLITSPLLEGSEVGLPNLVTRATQAGIRIYVWFVAAPDFFDSPSAVLLQDLAAQTGGEYFAFSNQEGIPDIETYLAPLRSVYQLTYTSRVVASGAQEAAAEINTIALQTVSAPRTFEIDVQPPNPIFVSPPSEIKRTEAELTGPEGKKVTPQPDLDLFVPSQQHIEVLVEFPDGHPREIVTSTLYVDGVIAAQNTAAPFEQFVWDLSPYTASGTHLLRIEVIDNLGLTGKTVDFPVSVTVERTPLSMLTVISRQGALLVGLVVVSAGGVLLLVLVLGGRIRPQRYGRPRLEQKKRRKGREITTRPLVDPLTQPVSPSTEAPSRWPNWLKRAQRHNAPTALAYLSPLSDDDEKTAHRAPISILSDELLLGNSPAHATIVLDDPSLEDLHTRLRREGQTYRVLDEGTIAGTWVNYLPVSPKGVLLTHGDVIHIGRVKLRFTLKKPAHVRKPVVRQEEAGS
ncbi:MAG: FHA domain-containing protein [Chloroflexota bacterium]